MNWTESQSKNQSLEALWDRREETKTVECPLPAMASQPRYWRLLPVDPEGFVFDRRLEYALLDTEWGSCPRAERVCTRKYFLPFAQPSFNGSRNKIVVQQQRMQRRTQ